MKSKTWLNHFSLLLVGLLFSITVSAQQKTVEGKVLDNVSGTPLVLQLQLKVLKMVC
jgi:hypothetical protein